MQSERDTVTAARFGQKVVDKGGTGRDTADRDTGQGPGSRAEERVGGLSVCDWELILKRRGHRPSMQRL